MKPKIKRVIDGKEHNIELTSEEVRSVYSSQSDDYLCEDASNQLKDYVEERYGTGEAALETFKEVHGYSLIELLENEEFMKKLASDFGDVQDCNIPENDTWESVIEDALDVFKENMSRARQKGMNGYHKTMTIKLTWEEIDEIIRNTLYLILLKKIECESTNDDNDYWGVALTSYSLTMDELTKIYDFFGATDKEREEAFALDEGPMLNALGMRIASKMIRRKLLCKWEQEFATDEGLWLIGCTMLHETDINGVKIMFDDLKSKKELFEFFNNNGPSHASLMDFCDEYRKKYRNELCWNYPISDGVHLGTFFVLVREGILCLPYDNADKIDYELFTIDECKMLDLESLEGLMTDWRRFSDDLYGTMRDFREYLVSTEKIKDAK